MSILAVALVVGVFVLVATVGTVASRDPNLPYKSQSWELSANSVGLAKTVQPRTEPALPPRNSAESTSDPWPMGITDYGRTSTGTTAYSSTSFLATATIESLSTSGSGSVGNDMTFQMNLNLGFEDGGNWYVYWIQDVAWVNTSNNEVFEFENNIWNFSSSSECLSNSALQGNGQVYSYSGCIGYYAYGVLASPELTYPGTFKMMVNSTENSLGQPVVRFMYNDGSGFVTYDVVTFAFVHALDYSDGFIVDASGYNPTGYLYYDAEFVMGGPGGGSSTTDESSDVAMFLQYWNGNNFETVNNALDYGYDTAETIASADAAGYYYTASGELFSQVSAGSESQSVLWYSSSVAIVEIEGPGSCNGVLDSGSVGTGYLDGYGAIAIWPASVEFQVACAGYTESLGTPSLSGGSTTVLSAGTWEELDFGQAGLPSGTEWGVSIGEESSSSTVVLLSFYVPVGSYTYQISGGQGYLPSPSAGTVTVGSSGGAVSVTWQLVSVSTNRTSADIGQSTQFSVSLTGASGDTFSWSGLPSGCPSRDSAKLTCVPPAAGTFEVTVSVTDVNGFVATSSNYTLVVYSDPAISAPVESRSSADVGQVIMFSTTFSPGSGSDDFSWEGLPTGCASSDSASVTCTPTAQGRFSVTVSIVDSNGFNTSATSTYTVYLEPTLEAISVSPGTSILEGQNLTFSVNVTEGSGGLTYMWRGLPPGCRASDSATVTCTPSASGTWNVSVEVTDSNGGTATSSGTSITVKPSFLGLPAIEGYTLVGAIVAILAVLLIVGFRRRSRRRQFSTDDLTIAERVRSYSPRVGPAPGTGTPVPATEAWSEAGPSALGTAAEEIGPVAINTVGTDPGSVYLSQPLINLPNPTCWNCRFQNPPVSRYCAKCGVPLEAPPGR